MLSESKLPRTVVFGAPAALLLLALIPLPYGYYTFLRIVVTLCAALAAFEFYMSAKWRFISYIFIGIAILFNPVLPIYLTRTIWAPFDVIVAGIFCFGLYLGNVREQ